MNGSYAGQLTLSGEKIDVDLEISSETLRLAAGATEIGSWPLAECQIIARGDGSYELVVEGDSLGFHPLFPDHFDTAIKPILAPTNGHAVESEPDSGEMDDDVPILPGVSLAGSKPAETQAVATPQTEAGPVLGDETIVTEPDVDPSAEGSDVQKGERRRSLIGSISSARGSREPGELGERSREPAPKRDIAPLAKKAAIGLGLAVLVAAVVATAPQVVSMVGDQLSAASEPAAEQTPAEPTPAPAEQPTESTQLAPTTTVAAASGVSVFAEPASSFVAAWNETGGAIADALRFDRVLLPGQFEEVFTDYVKMQGTVRDDATLERFTVIVDPSGPSASDRLGLQALGVAISVTEPELSGSELAGVLAQLGLDVDAPDLDGIDSSIERSGVVYELVYASGQLALTVTSAGG